MKKKIFSVLLSLMMLMTFAPLSVFAAVSNVSVPDMKDFCSYAPNKTSINVEWSKSEDSRAEYWLYRGTKTTGDWGPAYQKFSNDTTSFTDTNVTTGTRYYYMMRQVIVDNGVTYFGKYSNMDYGQPTIERVKNFSAWANDCTHATVSWSKTSDADAEYWLYRGTQTSGDWGAPIAKLSHDTTSYSDSNVKPTSNYYYLIRAVEKTSSGYLFGNYAPMDYAAPKCPPVKGFQAWAPNASEAYVSWQPYDNPDITYWLSRTEDPNQSDPDWGYPDLNPVAQLDKTMTPRLDRDIQAGHKYYYKLQTFQCVDGKFYFGPYSNVDYAYPR